PRRSHGRGCGPDQLVSRDHRHRMVRGPDHGFHRAQGWRSWPCQPPMRASAIRMRSYLLAKANGNRCWAYDPKTCLSEFLEQNCPNMVLQGSGFEGRTVFEAWVMAHPDIDGESMKLLLDHGADVFTPNIAFRVMFCHDPSPLSCLLEAGLDLGTTKLGT